MAFVAAALGVVRDQLAREVAGTCPVHYSVPMLSVTLRDRGLLIDIRRV